MKVLTVGVFDYFHYGHLKLFERAKALGDHLTVAVQRTEEIRKTKPDAKILYTLEQRMEIVGATKFVDAVVPYSQIADDIKNIDFDIFAIGEDQNHAGFQSAVKWCEENGKKVVLMTRTPGICSTDIKKDKKKYKVGYTCGVFDLFHTGHLNLLERCKAMCDVLIVGVCDDTYVRQIKNKEPVIIDSDRVRILNALECVDRAELVDIETTNNKMIAQERFGFDVLFSGDDWKGSERYKRTEEQFAKIGVKIEYLPYTQGVSTTDIKNKIQN